MKGWLKVVLLLVQMYGGTFEKFKRPNVARAVYSFLIHSFII